MAQCSGVCASCSRAVMMDSGIMVVKLREFDIFTYRDATEAVMAMDEASCAVVNRFLHSSEVPMIFCGTTTTSPGLTLAESSLGSNRSPDRRPTTEPLARIMKISLRFAVEL